MPGLHEQIFALFSLFRQAKSHGAGEGYHRASPRHPGETVPVPKPSTSGLLALLLALGCASASPSAPPDPRKANVYLIPMSGVRLDYVQSLARYYERSFSIQVEITPTAQPNAQYLSADGKRVVAAQLLILLRNSIKMTSDNPRALMVAITHFDLVQPRGRAGQAFSAHAGACCAAVSTSRLDPRNTGGISTDEEVAIRMRKLVTREIAFLYYGLPPNNDPTSILYAGQGDILTLEELDRLDESTLERDVLKPAAGS